MGRQVSLGIARLALVAATAAAAGAASCERGRSGGEPEGRAEERQGSTEHRQAAGAPEPVLEAYLAIHGALAADSTEGLADASRRLAAAADPHRAHGGRHAEVAEGLVGAAGRLGAATSLEQARQAFRSLSERMIDYRALVPAVAAETVVVHCPMANADWVQRGAEVQNPYHGSEMPRCGTVTRQRGQG